MTDNAPHGATKTPASSRRDRTTGPLICGLVAFWLYVLYSDWTQTGLLGSMYAFEQRHFGGGSTVGNLVLALVASMGLVAVLIGLLPGGDTPSVSGQKTMPARYQHAPTAVVETTTAKAAAKRRFIRPALLVLGVAVVAILIERDRHMTLAQVDLSAAPAAVPSDAAYAEVKALPAPGILSGYYSETNKSTYVEAYAPLVSPAWKPGEPVHYFIHHTSKAETTFVHHTGDPASPVNHIDERDTHKLPYQFTSHSLANFSGRIGGQLPVVVRQDFEARGAKVAPDAILLDWSPVHGHKLDIFQRYEGFMAVATVAGALAVMALVACVFWSVGWLRDKLRQR